MLIYDASYKTLINAKPLSIIFSNVDEFIRVYDGARYLVLLGPEKYDAIYNRIRYLTSQKLHLIFLIIMQKSKLIHMILYL